MLSVISAETRSSLKGRTDHTVSSSSGSSSENIRNQRFCEFLLLFFFAFGLFYVENKARFWGGWVVYIIIAMLWQEIKRVERKLDVEMFIDRVVDLHYGSSLGCAIERKERASPTEVPVY